MAENKSIAKGVASWRLDPDIIKLLKDIADNQGESQATILRTLIKKEAKRLGILNSPRKPG